MLETTDRICGSSKLLQDSLQQGLTISRTTVIPLPSVYVSSFIFQDLKALNGIVSLLRRATEYINAEHYAVQE